MPYIGIDFGTSNSVVANFQYGQADVLPNSEGAKWTPSVVTMRRDGSLSFGQEAKENFDEERSIRSIKRILGSGERVPFVGQTLRTEQIATMLFTKLKLDAKKANDGFLSVSSPSRRTPKDSAMPQAVHGPQGWVLTLINEPTAAAICYHKPAGSDGARLRHGGGALTSRSCASSRCLRNLLQGVRQTRRR